jgi:hypothetical protein
VIAGYGHANDQYLERLLNLYRSMPYEIDPVVICNIPKELDRDVEVTVGLPSKNPFARSNMAPYVNLR